MALAKLCKCGHTVRDHKTASIKIGNEKGKYKTTHKECEWFDCSCKKYVFEKFQRSGNLPKKIDKLIDVTIIHNEKKPKGTLKISDLDSFGHIKTIEIDDLDYKQPKSIPKFNNGEYP